MEQVLRRGNQVKFTTTCSSWHVHQEKRQLFFDIPKYNLKTENSMVGIIINRVQQSTEKKEAPKDGSQVQDPQQQQQLVDQQAIVKQKSQTEIRREANAAIGDELDDKLDQFFRACEERQRIHTSQAQQANAAHPPVVYVRNSLNVFNELTGGQAIYDSLTGAPQPTQQISQPVAVEAALSQRENMRRYLNQIDPINSQQYAPLIQRERANYNESMSNIMDQISRRIGQEPVQYRGLGIVGEGIQRVNVSEIASQVYPPPQQPAIEQSGNQQSDANRAAEQDGQQPR